MKSKILIYSFTHSKKRNISGEVMQKLKNIDSFSINCTSNEVGKIDIQKLLNQIKTNEYDFIIGIGIYSNKNNIIKFEKIAKNKFRNEEIEKSAPDFFQIGEFLNNDLNNSIIKISNKMGNSWCNFSSFAIKNEIIKSKLKAKNGFIHIPNLPENIAEFVELIQKEI